MQAIQKLLFYRCSRSSVKQQFFEIYNGYQYFCVLRLQAVTDACRHSAFLFLEVFADW